MKINFTDIKERNSFSSSKFILFIIIHPYRLNYYKIRDTMINKGMVEEEYQRYSETET